MIPLLFSPTDPNTQYVVMDEMIIATFEVMEPEVDQMGVSCTYGDITHPVGAEMAVEVRKPELGPLRASLVSQGWKVIHTTRLSSNRYRVVASCVGNLPTGSTVNG